MPCYDHYPTAQETQANEEIQALKARLDHVTDLLCSLRPAQALITAPQAVQDWWAQHAKDDEAVQTPNSPRNP